MKHPVLNVFDFLKGYSGGEIEAPSKVYLFEMRKQLLDVGIVEKYHRCGSMV